MVARVALTACRGGCAVCLLARIAVRNASVCSMYQPQDDKSNPQTWLACRAEVSSVAHEAAAGRCTVADRAVVTVVDADVWLASGAVISILASCTSRVAETVGLVTAVTVRNARVCVRC